MDVGYVEGVSWGEGVRWRGEGGKLGRGGGGGVGVLTWRAGQKCCFWALFGKLLHIGRPWMNVFVRVLQRREKLSLRPRPGKTAQKPHKNRSNLLEKPFKNHRKKWAVFERFFKQDLSGLSGFSKKTAQTAQILLENRSNRSNLERFLSGISTRVLSGVCIHQLQSAADQEWFLARLSRNFNSAVVHIRLRMQEPEGSRQHQNHVQILTHDALSHSQPTQLFRS